MRIRTYLSGDEAGLVDLFNKCFPQGIIRTERSWMWRYLKNPYFDPEGVIIAEDNGEVKGYLIGTPRDLFFKGQKVPSVIGDDFCVSPEVRGKGIGRTLLMRFMSFAEDRKALLMVYEGKDNLAHRMCTQLGWSTVDEFLTLRLVTSPSVDSLKTAEQERKTGRSDEPGVRRCSEKDLDKVIAFLNLSNRKKMGVPLLNTAEYKWRYLTYSNSDLKSIFLAEENESIVGHVAVTRHVTSSLGSKRFVLLSEPCGMIREIFESLRDLRGCGIYMAAKTRDLTQYESIGFTQAAIGVVVVKDYARLGMLQSAEEVEWYLFPESIFGEP